MNKIKKILEMAEVKIECLPEDTEIEGNASAIDEKTDKEIANKIRKQLDSGNVWAWCTVRVTVEIEGVFGEDFLGCCSYESEDDFKEDGYYEDMLLIASHNLYEKLEKCLNIKKKIDK